ncbi:hypothetical protein G6F52_013284 [Rhizopus delemar]|nr:hypothetical protein G6F54_013243 [Rhizopus delemar]KAG1493038.1 hypothetical protein G6F52_013284 [Rhizopus delemar]
MSIGFNLQKEPSIRYKKENIILVCVIPGPKEPKDTQTNNYLQVLVGDLKELYYDDFFTCTDESPNVPIQVRAALFLIACDILLAERLVAFPARYNTHLQRDFSFGLEDIDAWSLRTNIENRYHAKNWKEATTKRQRADLEQKYGTRFSALHDLEYLDLVRCTAIDPMHGLFLGTVSCLVINDVFIYYFIIDLSPAYVRLYN